MTTQFSVYLEDRPGTLAALLSQLRDYNVNIVDCMISNCDAGFAVFNFVPVQDDLVIKCLKANKYSFLMSPCVIIGAGLNNYVGSISDSLPDLEQDTNYGNGQPTRSIISIPNNANNTYVGICVSGKNEIKRLKDLLPDNQYGEYDLASYKVSENELSNFFQL